MYQKEICQEKIEFEILNIVKYNVNLLSSYLELAGIAKYENLDRGFWEITNVSKVDFTAEFSDAYKVVCLDCKYLSSKTELLDLINRFNNGWIPKI